jgi:hypothetical protein
MALVKSGDVENYVIIVAIAIHFTKRNEKAINVFQTP